jgi:hypothetical protein
MRERERERGANRSRMRMKSRTTFFRSPSENSALSFLICFGLLSSILYNQMSVYCADCAPSLRTVPLCAALFYSLCVLIIKRWGR